MERLNKDFITLETTDMLYWTLWMCTTETLSTQKPWNPKSQKWHLNKFHYKTACFSLGWEADCVGFWAQHIRPGSKPVSQYFPADPGQMRHVYWASVLPAANRSKLCPLCPLSNLLLSVELLSRRSHRPSQPGTCGNDVQKPRIQ